MSRESGRRSAPPERCDLVVVGGGAVGCATAMALQEGSEQRIVVLEAEASLAAHQTGHNSGVVHSGLYYRPGSLKAELCVQGRQALQRFCDEESVPYERCGKLVVATRPEELPRLEALAQRGAANGLNGLRQLGSEQLHEREPTVVGLAGLWVPQTGIVDYRVVTEAYARRLEAAGGVVALGARVRAVRRTPAGLLVSTGDRVVQCRYLVNCAGLQSDRVARLSGARPRLRIVPFRGEYYEVLAPRSAQVRGLIYPVPDPAFPFLGVHFTRTIDGLVEAGPNAVLALCREGYSRWRLRIRDVLSYLCFPGFWRLASRHWRMGVSEMWRSVSRRAFLASLRRLMPELEAGELRRAPSGVRAQALASSGQLVDDFCFERSERAVHVLNAPSPAATASISIGRTIAATAREHFGLPTPRGRRAGSTAGGPAAR